MQKCSGLKNYLKLAQDGGFEHTKNFIQNIEDITIIFDECVNIFIIEFKNSENIENIIRQEFENQYSCILKIQNIYDNVYLVKMAF